MAKYERNLRGSFQGLLNWIHKDMSNSGLTSTYEDGSNVTMGDVKLAVRVYERYSMIGANRVSLNVTLLGSGDRLFVSGISSGGSQALFFKINTFGEEAFLDLLAKSVEKYISSHP